MSRDITHDNLRKLSELLASYTTTAIDENFIKELNQFPNVATLLTQYSENEIVFFKLVRKDKVDIIRHLYRINPAILTTPLLLNTPDTTLVVLLLQTRGCPTINAWLQQEEPATYGKAARQNFWDLLARKSIAHITENKDLTEFKNLYSRYNFSDFDIREFFQSPYSPNLFAEALNSTNTEYVYFLVKLSVLALRVDIDTELETHAGKISVLQALCKDYHKHEQLLIGIQDNYHAQLTKQEVDIILDQIIQEKTTFPADFPLHKMQIRAEPPVKIKFRFDEKYIIDTSEYRPDGYKVKRGKIQEFFQPPRPHTNLMNHVESDTNGASPRA